MEEKFDRFLTRIKNSGAIEDVDYIEVKSTKEKPKAQEEIITVEAETVRKRSDINWFITSSLFSSKQFKW